MRLPRIAALSLLAFSLLDGPVLAQQRHNSNAPIDFGSDHIELQDKANRVILSGNVQVRQAEMTLLAARMTVAYTGKVVDGAPQATRIDASGNVVVDRPNQHARSEYGVYDLNKRLITMIGRVQLNQGSNVVNGQRLTLNLDNGRAIIDGGAVPGGNSGATGTTPGVTAGPGGRVTGRFSVPKRDTNAAPAGNP